MMTGEVVKFSFSSLMRSTKKHTQNINELQTIRMASGTGILQYRVESSAPLPYNVVLELACENGNIYHSDVISLKPGGKDIDWNFKADPIVISNTARFSAEKSIKLKYNPKKLTMLDLDGGSVHVGTSSNFSPQDQANMDKSQAECLLATYKYDKIRNNALKLFLTNLVAIKISAKQYNSFTPKETLAFINKNKYLGVRWIP